jgi:hypothetical protein
MPWDPRTATPPQPQPQSPMPQGAPVMPNSLASILAGAVLPGQGQALGGMPALPGAPPGGGIAPPGGAAPPAPPGTGSFLQFLASILGPYAQQAMPPGGPPPGPTM